MFAKVQPTADAMTSMLLLGAHCTPGLWCTEAFVRSLGAFRTVSMPYSIAVSLMLGARNEQSRSTVPRGRRCPAMGLKHASSTVVGLSYGKSAPEQSRSTVPHEAVDVAGCAQMGLAPPHARVLRPYAHQVALLKPAGDPAVLKNILFSSGGEVCAGPPDGDRV